MKIAFVTLDKLLNFCRLLFTLKRMKYRGIAGRGCRNCVTDNKFFGFVG